jgi:hypothetical protein
VFIMDEHPSNPSDHLHYKNYVFIVKLLGRMLLECCARLTIDNIIIFSPNHRHVSTPEHRDL